MTQMKTTLMVRSSSIALALSLGGLMGCAGDVDSGPGGNAAPGVPPLGAPAAVNPVTGLPITPNDPTGVNPMNTTGVPGIVPDPSMPATAVVPNDPLAPVITPTGMVTDPTMPPVTTPGQPALPDPNIDISNDPSLAEPLTAESAGPLMVRRLSPREYSNTLADLLGDTTNPGAELPDEATRASGFSVVESASTQSVRVFMDAAERLAGAGQIEIPCDGSGGETECATQFINDFGRQAFRRPVKGSELENLIVLFEDARALEFTVEESLRHVASAMLQSSGFLYVWEISDARPALEGGLVPLTQHQIASRLSYLITGSMPDAELAAAADGNQLTTPDQVAAQATRLITDPNNAERVSETLADFHLQWLNIENLEDLQKDTNVYPDFNDDVRASLAAELQSFVSNVLLEGDGTSRSLLTASHTFANADLGNVYGVAADDALAQVELDPAQRSGVLTQLAFLATNANTDGSLPPRRGKVLWERILCGTIPAPPGDVPAVAPPSENVTTRQRFEAHSENPCASACHNILDPAGFAFENYDGIGAYRTDENGLPVDASGTLVTPKGGVIDFTDAVDLMGSLSTSYEVDRCVARNWFRYMLNRPEGAADEASLEASYRAAGAGTAADFSVRDFVAAMARSTAFRYRTPGEGEAL